MAQIIKYQCRPEKRLTNQLIVESEWDLPEYVVCLQCQSCGVMGIAVLDKETAYNAECAHKFVNAENKAKGICGLCGISFAEWHG